MPTTAPAAAPSPQGSATGFGSAILGCGASTPGGVITNADLEAMVATSDAWIVERTGIRERRRLLPGETLEGLAAEAGRRALAAAAVPGVDALIVATCSREHPIPPVACSVQRELGLSGIPAFDLNAACSGYLYGLSVADSLIGGGVAGTVLLIGVDTLTPLVDYTDRTTCVLFGDAAGATVLGRARGNAGIVAIEWGADGRESGLIYYGVRPSDPHSEAGIRMAGKGTYRLAVERLCDVARRLCATAGWGIDDVDAVVPHQANLRIIESAMDRIGIPIEKAVINIDKYGNTSAASIPLALSDGVSAGRLHDGDRVLMVGFGAGVTWGGAALRWTGPNG